jgi:hypothetical protein
MKKKTFYPKSFCESIRKSAASLRMTAHLKFWTVSLEKLAGIMNGCGPDSWTDGMRAFASWVYREYKDPIAIHDFDFQNSDGDLDTLKIVNNRFYSNGKLKLDRLFPLSWRKFYLSLLRAKEWSKLQFAFIALKNGSETAWVDAHKRLNSQDPVEPLLSE